MAATFLLVILEMFLTIDGLRSNYFKMREISTSPLRSTDISTYIFHCGLACISRGTCKEFYVERKVKCHFASVKLVKNASGMEHWEAQYPISKNDTQGDDISFSSGQSILLAQQFSYNPILRAIDNSSCHRLNLNVTDRISCLTYAFTTDTLFIAKSMPSGIVSYVKNDKYGTLISKKIIRQFSNDEGSNFIAYVDGGQPNAIGAMDTNGKNHRTIYSAHSNMYSMALDPKRKIMYVHTGARIIKVDYSGMKLSILVDLDVKDVKMCFSASLDTLFYTVGMQLHTLFNDRMRKLVTVRRNKVKITDVLCHQERVFITFRHKQDVVVVEKGKARNFAMVFKPLFLSYVMTSYRSVLGSERTSVKCKATDIIVDKYL